MLIQLYAPDTLYLRQESRMEKQGSKHNATSGSIGKIILAHP